MILWLAHLSNIGCVVAAATEERDRQPKPLGRLGKQSEIVCSLFIKLHKAVNHNKNSNIKYHFTKIEILSLFIKVDLYKGGSTVTWN